MSIATQADIEGLLQFAFDITPEPKATAAIEAAQRVVEAEVGMSFDHQTGIVTTLTATGQTNLVLPRWPVSAITTLVWDGTTLVDGTDYEWAKDGTLQLAAGGPWWSDPNGVVVTYAAGWADADAAPGALRQLVARVATRIWQSGVAFAENQGVSGVVQETLGAYSVTFGDFSRDGSWAATLTDDDLRVARRFCRNRIGTVRM
jgi:hypothetical protein